MMLEAISSSMPVPFQAAPTSDHSREIARDFEAAMLTPMIADMLPPVGLEGPGSDVWQGFMAQAVAAELAQQGGLGLQNMIADQLTARSTSSGSR
jgi:Rod binding domain-containing protein